MPLDPDSGTWIYTGDEDAAPAPALWNRLAESVRDVIAPMRAARTRAWRARRTSGEAAFAAASFVTLVTLTIPAATPGVYQIVGRAVYRSSVTSAGYLRVLAGGAATDTVDPRGDVQAGVNAAHTTTTWATHAGGTLTINLQVNVLTGSPICEGQGTNVQAFYLGL